MDNNNKYDIVAIKYKGKLLAMPHYILVDGKVKVNPKQRVPGVCLSPVKFSVLGFPHLELYHPAFPNGIGASMDNILKNTVAYKEQLEIERQARYDAQYTPAEIRMWVLNRMTVLIDTMHKNLEVLSLKKLADEVRAKFNYEISDSAIRNICVNHEEAREHFSLRQYKEYINLCSQTRKLSAKEIETIALYGYSMIMSDPVDTTDWYEIEAVISEEFGRRIPASRIQQIIYKNDLTEYTDPYYTKEDCEAYKKKRARIRKSKDFRK